MSCRFFPHIFVSLRPSRIGTDLGCFASYGNIQHQLAFQAWTEFIWCTQTGSRVFGWSGCILEHLPRTQLALQLRPPSRPQQTLRNPLLVQWAAGFFPTSLSAFAHLGSELILGALRHMATSNISLPSKLELNSSDAPKPEAEFSVGVDASWSICLGPSSLCSWGLPLGRSRHCGTLCWCNELQVFSPHLCQPSPISDRNWSWVLCVIWQHPTSACLPSLNWIHLMHPNRKQSFRLEWMHLGAFASDPARFAVEASL